MEWPDAIEAVYVICHPEKEKERFERLIPHLLETGIPKDRIRITAPCWGSEMTVDDIFKMYDPFLARGIPSFSFKAAGLTRSELSLGANFAAVVQSAASTIPAGKLVMTLESDVWVRRDFVPRLHELLADASGQTWDYISLGEGVGTRPPAAPASYYCETRAWKPPHQWVFRCTDSMLFTSKYMQKLSKTFVPFKEIIDWEMNFQLMYHRGVALWADPPLAEQGTCYARTETSLPA